MQSKQIHRFGTIAFRNSKYKITNFLKMKEDNRLLVSTAF